MDRNKLIETQKWIKEQLDISVNFWLKNGMDKEHGGVYTCLDRKGEVYSTDKSVWMQGRCGWTFSYLCNMYGAKEEWLKAAKSCIDFLEKYCVNRDAGNRLYFTVTGDGKPLRQRRYCFSEGFYAMANAEYYLATGDEVCIKRAREAYELIWKLNNGLIEDPTGLGAKTIPETRSGRALADPMIYLNISAVMRRCDPENISLYNERSKICAEEIFTYFRKEDLKCTLESVAKDGTPELYYTAGRTVNPGHDIECAWFVMQEALYQGNDELYNKAVSMFDDAYNMGWDKKYDGLLYFTDCLGKPVEAYEHDMKLWWPHNELLIASMMIYRDTRDEKYLDIFYKTLEYCKKVFADAEYGEWYGYLRRDGLPTEPSTKGSTFKGPFHLPRCLIMVDKMVDDILKGE